IDKLNLHRTPFYCLTLLKATEDSNNENPINRTDLIHKVLDVLFNKDKVPSYKSVPDLKDCEFVLGYFCENLFLSCKYLFTREHFLEYIGQCCKKSRIKLDSNMLFDVLYTNNLLKKESNYFKFKFKFLLLYFASVRMYIDDSFRKYVFDNKIY